jgi:hypothetical protein
VSPVATAKKSDEFAGLARDVDVRQLVLDIAGKGVPDIDVSEGAISGEILRTIEGASEINVLVHDQARAILKSGALFDPDGHLKSADVQIDDVWFRLTSWRKQTDDLQLKLEDRRIARLRTKEGPRKAASRSKVTRAQYILVLVRSIAADKKLPVHIHELKKKQPVAKADKSDKKRLSKAEAAKTKKDAQRGRGFDSGAAKALGLEKPQLDNIGVFLDEAELVSAPPRAILAGLVGGFGEGNWSKDAKNGIHQGVFQSAEIPGFNLEGQSHHFLVGGRSFREGGAIAAAKANPSWTPGKIASYVEISDAAAPHYDTYRPRADAILEAWGGTTGGQADVGANASYYKRYEFKVDKDENYWDAIQRLAKEVNWRAFISGNTFYYIDEPALFKSRAQFRVSEDTPGVSNIDAEQDYRKRTAKAVISCRIDAWEAPPGTIVIIEGLNTKGSQRWLVSSITRNLFSPEATIECKRPMGKRKEPRSDLGTRSTTQALSDQGGAVGGSPKDVIDFYVLPIAREQGINITAAQVVKANAVHGPTATGGRSDHQGPPEKAWAADMPCIGEKGDRLCKALASRFGFKGDGKNSYTRVVADGFSYQLLWGPAVGHTDHVHFGVQALTDKPISVHPNL